MSYSSGEAAEQVVRMTLNGVEVAAKISGKAAERLAVLLYAVLKDQKKTRGKTRLNSMLRSGKELKVFAIGDRDLEKFCREAKKYGILYCVLKDKTANDGHTDVFVRAEDASKINRIFDRFGIATADIGSARTEIVKAKEEQKNADIPVPDRSTTEKDKEAAGALAKIAGIADPQAYALEMLQAGSAINSMTAEEICHGDMKEFDFPQGKVTVAQVNVMNGEAAKAKWPELQKALQTMVDGGEADTSLLMVTDIMDEVTELLWAGKNKDILDKAFGKAEADGHYHLPKVLSRKKQIVPPLTDAFKG